MGIEIGAALAVSSLAMSAVGTGMAVYGQMQQASNAQRMAAYNASVQQQNANLNYQLATRQAQMGLQASQFNAGIAAAQSQAQLNNAKSLENAALTAEAQGRERARRLRAESEKFQAIQRGRMARAGVAAEGTPLVVLAETAKLADLNAQDAIYETDLERRKLLDQAGQSKWMAGMSLLDSQIQTYSGQQQFAYDQFAAKTGMSTARREAEITRLIGASDAAGYRMGAASSLISGVGSLAGSGYDYYRNRPASTPRYKEG